MERRFYGPVLGVVREHITGEALPMFGFCSTDVVVLLPLSACHRYASVASLLRLYAEDAQPLCEGMVCSVRIRLIQ